MMNDVPRGSIAMLSPCSTGGTGTVPDVCQDVGSTR